MSSLRRALAVLALAGGITGLAGAVPAQAFGCGTVLAPPPNPVGGNQNNELNGLAVVSACDIWAVGDYEPADGSAQALIEHWTGGGNWAVVPSPGPGTGVSGLEAVSADSPADVWAVGAGSGVPWLSTGTAAAGPGSRCPRRSTPS